ncbi:hypothetical protein C0991_004040 [Blastosporella zonata]|nr:hypothetical protein C0991_004040 [Blastosporella zonata]
MSNPTLNTSIRMDAADHALGAALTITTLLKEVSSLIPSAGPLANVLGVAKELINIVNQMSDNKDQCDFLVERILRFLSSLANECAGLEEPIRSGTPTAHRLNKLISAIEEIKKDAEVWKNTSRLDRFWSRDKIKAAIVKHEKNLSDCFLTFMVGTGIQLGATSDNSIGERGLGVRPDSNLVAHSE